MNHDGAGRPSIADLSGLCAAVAHAQRILSPWNPTQRAAANGRERQRPCPPTRQASLLKCVYFCATCRPSIVLRPFADPSANRISLATRQLLLAERHMGRGCPTPIQQPHQIWCRDHPEAPSAEFGALDDTLMGGQIQAAFFIARPIGLVATKAIPLEDRHHVVGEARIRRRRTQLARRVDDLDTGRPTDGQQGPPPIVECVSSCEASSLRFVKDIKPEQRWAFIKVNVDRPRIIRTRPL